MKKFNLSASFVGIYFLGLSSLVALRAEDLTLSQQGPILLIDPPVKATFVPQGFDSNDLAEFVVEVELPDNAYRIAPVEVRLHETESRIDFNIKAYRYPQIGLPVITHSMVTVNIPKMLKKDNYALRHLGDKKFVTVGSLPVDDAKSEKRDDYSYAMVHSAAVTESMTEGRYLTLFGTFSQNCLEFDGEPRITKTSDSVIEVLPIIRQKPGEKCEEIPTRFMKLLRLSDDIPGGHYLFHIRKGDGSGFNLLENLKDVVKR